MNTGELWVTHPLFPWIMVVLAFWIGCSTIVMARNWVRLRRLERHNKLLQEMLVEGVGSVAKRVTAIENRIPILKPISRQEKRSEELSSGKSGIRTEEQPAAAIEETDEDGDDLITLSEDTERTSVRST